MSDSNEVRRVAGSALRGFVAGVGKNVSEAVRHELDSPDTPAGPRPTVIAAVSGIATGVGQSAAEALRQELGAARSQAVRSAKAAGRGAGLLGGAAVAGNTAVLFTGIALWRGLGNRIGYAKSAVVVAALAGGAAAMLATNGVAELTRMQQGSRAGSPRTRPVGAPVVPAPSAPADDPAD